MIATIFSNYYSAVSPYSDVRVRWYIRDPLATVLTANLPLLWPLTQMIFKLCGGYSRTRTSPPNFPSYPRQSELRKPKRQKKKTSGWTRHLHRERAPLSDMVIQKPNPTLAPWPKDGAVSHGYREVAKDPWEGFV